MITDTITASGDVWTYAYNFAGQMTGAVEKTSGGTVLAQVSYTYDALGNRIGMDENGTQTWTLYDGSDPIMDFNSSGSLEMRYLNGPTGQLVDSVLARESSGGTVAWYLPDRLGTVRDLINNSGSIIDHIDFSAFGTVLDQSDPSEGDRMMGFAGMELDSVTGLNLAMYRVQNPGTGRWTSQDPGGFGEGDADLYRYTGNGPVDTADPAGLGFWSDYLYYLSNPGQMDGDLQTGQKIAIGTAVLATTAASGGIAGELITAYGGGAVTVGAGSGLVGGVAGDLVGQGTSIAVGLQKGYNPTQTAVNGGVGALGGAVLGKLCSLRGAKAGQLSCFPAGTLVATRDGSRPIESIVEGQFVWAYDLVASEWQLRRVLRACSRLCNGMAVSATVGDETVDSTSRHPYFVARGDELEGRPRLEHLADVPAGATTPGRWVDAADLRVGDELVLLDGGRGRVDQVRLYPFFETVYNFEVDDLHCYAVGRSGVLVHNNNGAEIPAQPASTPVGKSGNPLGSVHPNQPTTIGGRPFSGHALDQMQARGVPPSVVENTIQNGRLFAGNKPGTIGYYDPVNNLRIIINSTTGKVVTVIPGPP